MVATVTDIAGNHETFNEQFCYEADCEHTALFRVVDTRKSGASVYPSGVCPIIQATDEYVFLRSAVIHCDHPM
jgi:hypothetical protein